MANTLIRIHGRAHKPTANALRDLWVESLRHGLERDHPERVSEFDQTLVEIVYYGDINNRFLEPQGHDVAGDEASRRQTLARLKGYSRADFFDAAIYNGLPGKNSKFEFAADVLSGVAAFLRVSEPLIHLVAPDMKEYWNPESAFGSDVRFPMIHPLRAAMDRDDTILAIAHSLGTMITDDTFWKFSRTGEYRPEYTDKKIDLFITIGSPLGDETVKTHLKGAQARRERRYPSNIRRWINIAAEDDCIAHDQNVADDFRDMLDLGLVESIDDRRIFNLAVRNGKSNPHHGAGYLIHPVLGDVVANWLQ